MRLNQGLVVALDSPSVLDRPRACFLCYFFGFWVHALLSLLVFFIISTSAIDCLGRFVSEMTDHVSSGTLYLTKPKPVSVRIIARDEIIVQLRKPPT